MNELLGGLIRHLEGGENLVLCQVLSATGSAPRGAGARMAVLPDGTSLGTVGGGNVELESIRLSQELLRGGRSCIRTFPLHPAAEGDLGMVCGGDVRLLFQLIRADDGETLEFLKSLRPLRAENVYLLLTLSETAGVRRAFAWREGEPLPAGFSRAMLGPKPALCGDETLHYAEQIFRAGFVYLFGGGHVGQALVPVLAPLGFRVVVLDDRPELADLAHFPQAADVRLCDFSRISLPVTRDDFCIVMTPGHKSDFAILSQVLRTEAAYIGCIGSRVKIAKTNELLRAEGFSEADCRRIHSPIGLPIGAVTPEEIAVSIAAELISFRAGLIS